MKKVSSGLIFVALVLFVVLLASLAGRAVCQWRPGWGICQPVSVAALFGRDKAEAHCLDRGGEMVAAEDGGREYRLCRLANDGACEAEAYLAENCDSGLSLEYEKKSAELAKEWVKYNAGTYAFDGYDLRLAGTKVLACVYCFEYVFSFSSRHGGFGDRSGLVLSQAVTEHETAVRIEKGEVKSAVTDGRYDEISQKERDK